MLLDAHGKQNHSNRRMIINLKVSNVSRELYLAKEQECDGRSHCLALSFSAICKFKKFLHYRKNAVSWTLKCHCFRCATQKWKQNSNVRAAFHTVDVFLSHSSLNFGTVRSLEVNDPIRSLINPWNYCLAVWGVYRNIFFSNTFADAKHFAPPGLSAINWWQVCYYGLKFQMQVQPN